MNWWKKVLAPCVLFLLIALTLEVLCDLSIIKPYIMPAPSLIIARFADNSNTIMNACAYTLIEATLGLLLGAITGFLFAVLMDRFILARVSLAPLLSISQSIPVIAIAPILVLVFGFGMQAKVFLVALMTFFPIAIGLLGAFQNVPEDTILMSRSLGATYFRTLIFVKLPHALPYFFANLRISVTYAFSGAVISEWLGGDAGLGVFMTRARKSFDYVALYQVILVICVVTILCVVLVKLLERRICKWNFSQN